MTTLRSSVTSHALTSSVQALRAPLVVQRRWARVLDVRFVTTHPDGPDRVLERYRDKLSRRARQEGLPTVKDLQEAYKDKIETLRKEPIARPPKSNPEHVHLPSPRQDSRSTFPDPPPAPSPSTTSVPVSASNGTSLNKSASPPGLKSLSSYIDIPKTLELPPKEIEVIWRLRHAHSPRSLCAVIPTPVFRRIAATAQKHPQFILPLPARSEDAGAELHFLQWTFPAPDTVTVLFTHLAEYKLRGEFAQPHTTLTHHMELADAKGVVLMKGEVLEGRGVSVDEGKWLVMGLQKFYGAEETDAERAIRKVLLEKFSRGDEGFRVEELLEEAEKIV